MIRGCPSTFLPELFAQAHMFDVPSQVSVAFRQHALLYGGLCAVLAACLLFHRQLWPYWRFFYACFLKPVDHGNAADVKALSGQQRALEGFYRTQAEVYDVTRGLLLCGREDMLQLAAAQLKHRMDAQSGKPIWVDVCIHIFQPFITTHSYRNRSAAGLGTTSRR